MKRLLFICLLLWSYSATADHFVGPGYSAYKPNYIVLGPIVSDPVFPEQGGDDGEIHFQVSFKIQPFVNGVGWFEKLRFAYSQRSFWIVGCCSSPFRETNYNPELFFDTTTVDWLYKRRSNVEYGLRQISLYEHQSNGREDDSDLSRGWDRVGNMDFYFRNGDWSAGLKYEPSATTSSPGNVDMVDYFGRNELYFKYETIPLLAGASFRKGRLANTSRYELELGYQLFGEKDKPGSMLYVKYWNGVGESLMEYDKKTSRFMIGFLLSRDMERFNNHD
ncbi:MAG: phospholipase A [Gammaproteobacteria bacterium]|nr:phospholipase A [Gammaproteobacteria bacterium]